MGRYYKWDGSPVYAFRFEPDSAEDAIRAGIVHRGNGRSFILTTTGLQEPVNFGDYIITHTKVGFRGAHSVLDSFTFEKFFEPAEDESAPVSVPEAVTDPGTERLAAAVERLTDEVAGLRSDFRNWFGTRIEIVDISPTGPAAETGLFTPIHELFRAGRV